MMSKWRGQFNCSQSNREIRIVRLFSLSLGRFLLRTQQSCSMVIQSKYLISNPPVPQTRLLQYSHISPPRDVSELQFLWSAAQQIYLCQWGQSLLIYCPSERLRNRGLPIPPAQAPVTARQQVPISFEKWVQVRNHRLNSVEQHPRPLWALRSLFLLLPSH